MARYLLDELSAEDRAAFENVCFADAQVYEELLAVEAELTDDYVRGVLVGRRREQFEKRLLNSPARREELELARCMMGAPDGAPAVESPDVVADRAPRRSGLIAALGSFFRPLRLSLATAALVLVGVGVWLLWPSRTAGPPPGQVVTERERPEGQTRKNSPITEPPPEVERNNTGPETSPHPRPTPARRPSPPKQTSVVTLALALGSSRDQGGVNELNIPRGAARVRLLIDLPADEHSVYRASLRPIAGPEILTRNNLKARETRAGRALVLELPAAALPAGDHFLSVSGVSGPDRAGEVVANYFLRIRR